MIYQHIEDVIGNTPLLRIDGARYGIEHVDIYVKLEYLNPFGSVKDRTTLSLTQHIDFDEMRRTGAKLIESSSGNAAKALRMLAHRREVGLTLVTNRIKVPEVDMVLKYLETDIVNLPGRSECPDPNDPDNVVAVIERMVAENPSGYRHTAQYTSADNPRAHETTTAVELYRDLERIDYFVAGVGTGGSTGGMLDYIERHQLATKCVGVVSHPSDFLPGIRTNAELFETPLFHADRFEAMTEVTSKAALEALDLLVRNEGVLAGPTTGGNFAAVLEWCRAHDALRSDGTRQTVVFLACDRLEPYMSYIEKRLPERFGRQSYSDLYDMAAMTDEAANDLTVEQLEASLRSDEPPLVIDTRGVKAYELFHIEQSVCYPEELLHELFEEGVPFRGRSVVFVCPRGDRSRLYARLLDGRGVTAHSLQGGLMAWRRAGKPMTKRAKAV